MRRARDARAAKAYAAAGEKQRLFAFFSYKAKTWNQRRTVVAKAEHGPDGPNLRFIVTNLRVKRVKRAQEAYGLYVRRGESGQRMDELKNGLSAGRLSCHRFNANFLRLMLHTPAFNLLNAPRGHKAVPEELRAARPETWRTRIIKVAATIEQTTRRVWVRVAASWPFWDLLQAVGERALHALAAPKPRAAGP